MRELAYVVLVFCFFCFFVFSAIAGPKEEALNVLERWSKAFAASDVDAITDLYSADTLFMGTGSKTVVTQKADIKKYFDDALLTRRPRAAPN